MTEILRFLANMSAVQSIVFALVVSLVGTAFILFVAAAKFANRTGRRR